MKNINKSKKKKKVNWNKATVKKYEKWLRRRAFRRYENGKRKTSWKLVRKLIRAHQLVDKKWKPSMADAPTAGHHVPPLALSNKHKGKFVFGPRGKPQEKKRKRVYFRGNQNIRKESHGLAHISEAMQGLNRLKDFKGTNKELAKKMILAHKGLRTSDGKRIMVNLRSQIAKNKGQKMEMNEATHKIMESRAGKINMKFNKDPDTSAPESDFLNLGSDSDVFKDYSSRSSGSSSSSSNSSSSSSSESNSSDTEMTDNSNSDYTSSSSSSSNSESNSSETETDAYDTEMTNNSSSSSSPETENDTEMSNNSSSSSSESE